MLEILVVMAAIYAIAMAKAKPRRRRSMGRYLRGSVDQRLSLGTLAANTLISQISADLVTERTRVTSAVLNWSLDQWTAATDDGPILVGIAHSDYSDAEIEEYLESTGSWSEGDLVQSKEIAKRLVRRIGLFEGRDTAIEHDVLNDGKPIKTRLNWILNAGQGLRWWAYNAGTSALATTDPNVHILGHVNLFPQ